MKTKTQSSPKSRVTYAVPGIGKTKAPKLNVCTKTVAESFAGFSDQNLKKVALTLLKMLSKRSESRAGLIVDAVRAVDPFVEFDGVMFVPAKRRKVKAA